MTVAERDHSYSLLGDRCEVHYACSGFYNREEMKDMLAKLSECVTPLIVAGKPIYAMGDFTGYVPQDRETADMIGKHLEVSRAAGLKRSAIIGATPLVKLQYKRISSGLEVGFFDTKPEALEWLRADR